MPFCLKKEVILKQVLIAICLAVLIFFLVYDFTNAIQSVVIDFYESYHKHGWEGVSLLVLVFIVLAFPMFKLQGWLAKKLNSSEWFKKFKKWL
jgi:ABC-type Fe3+-siderophore transport system permease subunit